MKLDILGPLGLVKFEHLHHRLDNHSSPSLLVEQVCIGILYGMRGTDVEIGTHKTAWEQTKNCVISSKLSIASQCTILHELRVEQGKRD